MNEDKKNYTLITLDENIEREPVYYYSRDHRLSRASSIVRDLNDGKLGKKSVVKNLFGSRGNVMTFILIIITSVMLSFVSKYSRTLTDVKLGGNTVKLSIQKDEETLNLDIIKQGPKTGNAYSGEVEIAVSPVIPKLNEGETSSLFFDRIYFTRAGYENFQVLLPFDFDKNEFILLLKTSDEQKSVKLRAKR